MGKFTHLHPTKETTAPLITKPEEDNQEADNHGTRANGPRTGAHRGQKKILQDIWPDTTSETHEPAGRLRQLRHVVANIFLIALQKRVANNGAGMVD